ncbi:hypothetical protein ACOME3_006675 [Neoechinorhynchus agilis]
MAQTIFDKKMRNFRNNEKCVPTTTEISREPYPPDDRRGTGVEDTRPTNFSMRIPISSKAREQLLSNLNPSYVNPLFNQSGMCGKEMIPTQMQNLSSSEEYQQTSSNDYNRTQYNYIDRSIKKENYVSKITAIPIASKEETCGNFLIPWLDAKKEIEYYESRRHHFGMEHSKLFSRIKSIWIILKSS